MWRQLLVLLPFLLAAAPAGAARIEWDENRYLDLGFFLQTRAQLVERGAPDGESASKDIYLRRVRLGLSGRMSERLLFAFNTESANFGRDDFSTDIYVLDARATWLFARELELDVGQMLTPSLHNANQASGRLHTLDLHSAVFRFPAQSTTALRDTGVQIRGIVAGDRLQYRAGLFRGTRGEPLVEGEAPVGAQGLNPDDAPRLAGALRFNFLEAEPGFTFAGISFGERRVLSVGVAGEWQKDASRDVRGHLADWSWVGADLFVDLPTGPEQEILGQVAISRWEAGSGAAGTGNAYYGDLGYRYRRASLYGAFERFDAEAAAGDLHSWRVGSAWWIDRHQTNLKGEVERRRLGVADWQWVGTLQLQIWI